MTKLKWGLIGGGEGSQIGPAHRLGAQADGHFDFVAGALDHRADVGRAYAQRLGIVADRAYGDWREMLAGESAREDRVDLVTVATPNSTHFEITKAFLEAGFNVLCEKPMTVTVEEGEEIVKIARDGCHRDISRCQAKILYLDRFPRQNKRLNLTCGFKLMGDRNQFLFILKEPMRDSINQTNNKNEKAETFNERSLMAFL